MGWGSAFASARAGRSQQEGTGVHRWRCMQEGCPRTSGYRQQHYSWTDRGKISCVWLRHEWELGTHLMLVNSLDRERERRAYTHRRERWKAKTRSGHARGKLRLRTDISVRSGKKQPRNAESHAIRALLRGVLYVHIFRFFFSPGPQIVSMEAGSGVRSLLVRVLSRRTKVTYPCLLGTVTVERLQGPDPRSCGLAAAFSPWSDRTLGAIQPAERCLNNGPSESPRAGCVST